jgi:hypothetical protein
LTPNPLPQNTSRWCVPLYPEAVPHYMGPSPLVVADVTIRNRTGTYTRGFAAVSTALTLSVIPPRMAALLNVQFAPDPRWVGIPVPDWYGVPCEIGGIVVQFPVGWTPPATFYHVLVRRPLRNEPWMGTRLLLGTHFLKQVRAELWVDFANPDYSHPRRSFGEMRL